MDIATSQQESETELLLPPAVFFPGEFDAKISTRESVYITRNATVHVFLAATAR